MIRVNGEPLEVHVVLSGRKLGKDRERDRENGRFKGRRLSDGSGVAGGA